MFAYLTRVARRRARGGALLRRFGRDRSGNIAMMFALAAVPLFAAVGLAVDLGRIYHVALDTQGALDAAALAAGRVAQVDKNGSMNNASQTATIYFNQAKPSDVVESNIAFSPNDQRTEFTVTATSWVKTPFLSVLHLFGHKASEDDAPPECRGNYYACTKVVTTASAQICLNCASDDGTNLEISMMLDLTGSMAGDKIEDLQLAAKDLIDIVVWEDQSKWTSKVALAPFAAAVNVGPYFTKITGEQNREDNDGKSNLNIHYPPWCFNGKGKLTCSSKDYNDVEYIAKYAPCVVERNGGELNGLAKGEANPQTFTDAAPADKLTYLPTWNAARDNKRIDPDESSADEMAKSCSPTVAVVPLTSDRQKLKDAIDDFKTNGATAGQLGTAFAWYLLSPNWSNVWPTASTPAPYGKEKLKKIAVLMTDGEYNTLQAIQYNDGSAKATEALNHAKSLCTAMKKNAVAGDPNIEIYTVGFKLTSSAAKAMLKNCATSTDHYYETSTGDALRAAFRDIALKISRLRLTN